MTRCEYFNVCESKTQLEYELFCNRHYKLCDEYRWFKKSELDMIDFQERIRKNEGLDLVELSSPTTLKDWFELK